MSKNAIWRGLTLGGLTLLLTSVLYVGLVLNRKYQAIRLIESKGGSVDVEYHSAWGISDEQYRWLDDTCGWKATGRPVWAQLGSADESVMNAVATLSTLQRISSFEDEELSSKRLLRLKSLKRLQQINVWVRGGPEDDELLASLDDWPDLVCLSLGKSKVTDVGVAACARHPSLVHLHLGGVGISDASVDIFKRMPHLKYMELESNVAITDSAFKELVSARPDLTLVYQGAIWWKQNKILPAARPIGSK